MINYLFRKYKNHKTKKILPDSIEYELDNLLKKYLNNELKNTNLELLITNIKNISKRDKNFMKNIELAIKEQFHLNTDLDNKTILPDNKNIFSFLLKDLIKENSHNSKKNENMNEKHINTKKTLCTQNKNIYKDNNNNKKIQTVSKYDDVFYLSNLKKNIPNHNLENSENHSAIPSQNINKIRKFFFHFSFLFLYLFFCLIK